MRLAQVARGGSPTRANSSASFARLSSNTASIAGSACSGRMRSKAGRFELKKDVKSGLFMKRALLVFESNGFSMNLDRSKVQERRAEHPQAHIAGGVRR